MARITTPLTDTQIKQAKPKDKEYNLADGKGLMLRIKPTGSKLWLFNYVRPYIKKRANLSFGSYPDLSLADARRKSQEARDLLAKDIDPKTQKEKVSLSKRKDLHNTFEKIALAWFEIYKTKVTAKTARNTLGALNLHIFPHIGKKPINEIEAFYVIEIIRPLATKGKLETVKQICQKLNKIMTFAVNTGLAKSNPLAGIKDAFEAPTVTHLPTIKPEELPSLLTSLNNSNMKLITRHLIYWQLHTMVRSSEAAGAMWQEIDTKNNVWVIPGERMKMKRQHIVPLTEQAIAILNDMKPLSGNSEYIFPADQISRHINTEAANKALRKLGYKNKLVAHGLRSLASTTLNEQGFDPDVIEAALAHVDKNEVRRAYNRTDYIERRRKLMMWWSDHISEAITGKKSKSKSGLRIA